MVNVLRLLAVTAVTLPVASLAVGRSRRASSHHAETLPSTVTAYLARRLVPRHSVVRMHGHATAAPPPEIAHADDHDERRDGDRQGLGRGRTDRLQPWL